MISKCTVGGDDSGLKTQILLFLASLLLAKKKKIFLQTWTFILDLKCNNWWMLSGHISLGLSLLAFTSSLGIDFWKTLKGWISFEPVSPLWRVHLFFGDWVKGAHPIWFSFWMFWIIAKAVLTHYGTLKRLRNSAVYFFHSCIVGMERKIIEILMDTFPRHYFLSLCNQLTLSPSIASEREYDRRK